MVQESGKRKKPNILVTGTPGTGKTTTSTALAEATQLRHINVGELVKEKNLHDGWDDELDCHVLNEDLVSYQFFLYLRSFLYVVVWWSYWCLRCMRIKIKLLVWLGSMSIYVTKCAASHQKGIWVLMKFL